ISNLQTQNLHLAEEQKKLSSTIASVSDGVIAINEQMGIVTINPPAAKLVHKKPQELVDKPLGEFFQWKQANKPFNLTINRPGTYHFDDITLSHADQVAYLDVVVTVLEHKTSNI